MRGVFERSHATWVIALSFLLAGCLAMLPMPDWLLSFRPEWVVVVLIYWVVALPHRVGLGVAWLVGFFLDVLEGSLLGLNALALTLIAYMAVSLYQRLRMFTFLQQGLTVLILVGIYQLLCFWILAITDHNTAEDLSFLAGAVTSALVWPFIFVTLRHYRRSFRVN